MGPYVAGTVIGYVVDVARFADRDHFAAYNGAAPIEVSSGGHKVFRLSRRGNRRLNHAVHMAAVTQVAHRHSEGRAYYDRKLKEGKTNKEAPRCLKRRVDDAIFAHLVADAKRKAQGVAAGPGGQRGNGSVSSVAGSHPSASSSDKPLPGPSPPYVVRPLAGARAPQSQWERNRAKPLDNKEDSIWRGSCLAWARTASDHNGSSGKTRRRRTLHLRR